MVDFNPKAVEKYIKKSHRAQEKAGFRIFQDSTKINNAIMSFFDANYDGIVTNVEFYNKSKEDYELYKTSLFNYIDNNPGSEYSISEKDITAYNDIAGLFEKRGYFKISSLISKESNPYIKPDIVIPEQKHKTAYSHTSKEELLNDLQYINDSHKSEPISKIRKNINLYDEKSDIVDWHIGTFNQGILGTCVLDSAINQMDDTFLKKLYTMKRDETTDNIYYEFNFENDKRKNPVTVTEQELKNKYIQLGSKTIIGFSEGDEDATLIEMAFIKLCGDNIVQYGCHADDILNLFFYGDTAKYRVPTDEILQDLKPSLTSLWDLKTLKKAYNYNKESNTIILPEGQEIKIIEKEDSQEIIHALILPDGTEILENHFHKVYKYDPEKKEVLIVDPHDNSTDIAIPLDIYKQLFLIAV